MSDLSTEEFKDLMAGRRLISFSRREKMLIFFVPFYITMPGIARLNGEGYRLKFDQYWRILLWRVVFLFAIFLIAVYIYGLRHPVVKEGAISVTIT